MNFASLYLPRSLHLINLNVDYVSPSCIMPGGVWPLFTAGYYTLLIIPLIPFALCGALYALARFWALYVKQESLLGLRLGFMVSSPEFAWQYLTGCIKAAIPFPGIVYNSICQLSFSVFSCQQLRNGVSVMAAAPAIVCWESSTHRGLVAASITALIFYVVGVPAFTLGTVMYARRKDLLKHPDVLRAFGFFYTWYSKWPHLPLLSRSKGKLRDVQVCRTTLLLVGDHAVLPEVLFVPLCGRVSHTSDHSSGAPSPCTIARPHRITCSGALISNLIRAPRSCGMRCCRAWLSL